MSMLNTISVTEVASSFNSTNDAQEAQDGHHGQSPSMLLQARELVSITRPSFVKLCKDKCMAVLLNHFLYWISWKCKDQEKYKIQAGMITYYATTKELAECIDWCEKKVRLSVNALIELGIIGLTHNQKYKMDRTKHFFFGRDQYKKLIELCVKNSICLAHIGLPKEIMQMLAAFSETVPCPCSKQMVKIPDASGKNDHMQTVKTPDASGKNDHFYTKITDKDCNLDIDKERMNRVGQQNVDTDEPSHSSIHPSHSNSKFSSAEEKTTQKEKVVYSEQEEQAFEIAKLLKLARLKKDAKNREHCAKMVENDILTYDKMDKLKEYSFEKLRQLKGDNVELYLGNLAGDINGWLLAEEAKRRSASTDIFGNKPEDAQETTMVVESTVEAYSPESAENIPQVVEDAKDDDVTDDELIDKMQYICQDYGQDTYLATCCNTLADIRDEYRLNNAKLFDSMTEAYRWTLQTRKCDVQSFFDELYGSLAQAS
jgi:hypothetical protein